MVKYKTKLYDRLDDFYFVARMPNFHSNIPLSIFLWKRDARNLSYSKIIFFYYNFYEKASAMAIRIEKEGGNREKLLNKL